MKHINLGKILGDGLISSPEMAELLFPGIKHPARALSRVILGQSELTTSQISRLSLRLDIPIGKLFDLGSWTASTKNETHVFTNGDYRAELDKQSWSTKIFHKDSLFHDSVITQSTVTLSDYLEELTKIIQKHGKN